MSQAAKVTKLFDNLVRMEALQAALEQKLGRRYSVATIRRWIRVGMPVERLKTRELFFRVEEVLLWLHRSA